jgi:hypothetical protein
LKIDFSDDLSCSSDEASFDGSSFENPADIYIYNTIEWVVFSDSSGYSVPKEVFTKFTNLKVFWASGQSQRHFPGCKKIGANLDKQQRTDLPASEYI